MLYCVLNYSQTPLEPINVVFELFSTAPDDGLSLFFCSTLFILVASCSDIIKRLGITSYDNEDVKRRGIKAVMRDALQVLKPTWVYCVDFMWREVRTLETFKVAKRFVHEQATSTLEIHAQLLRTFWCGIKS